MELYCSLHNVNNKTVENSRIFSLLGVKRRYAENAEFIVKNRVPGTLKSYLPSADWLVNNGSEEYLVVGVYKRNCNRNLFHNVFATFP